jgi:glycosyltransferase involved in cell wall biosynthesis
MLGAAGGMGKLITVCIPVFNEAKNLPLAVQAVEDLFRAELPGYSLELVVTDNASTDETWSVVQRLAAERPFLVAFRFSRNFGYQNSVFTGLSLARGDAVVEMDADLEDPPRVIPQFVKKWEEGFHVAYGARKSRHGFWLARAVFALFYRLLNALSDIRIPNDAGDFRLLDRKVVDVLKALPERNLYLRGLISYLGFRQVAVPYDREPRASGRSKFRLGHYLVMAIDAFTSFTKAPLRLIGMLGASLFVGTTLLSGYYLAGRLVRGTPVPGFTTLIVFTLMLHSITFIFIGVLGEYLSRIFDDSKGRPRVVIAEAINSEKFPPVL